MRVAAFTSYEDVADIEVRDRADPEPGAGEAVVRVEAASLNHRDLWKLKGESGGDADLPFVAGGDLAGTVAATGPDVDSVAAGDRVVLCPLLTCGTCEFCREGPENMCEHYDSYDGAFAERALVRADRLVPLPDAVDVVDAAALPIAYMTAYRMLKRGGATAGDRVFVPGATGGVGMAAVQLAGLLGARTIGTSTSARKLDRVERAGLDHAIHTGDPEAMREAVAEIGDVDVTVNHLGGPYTRVGAAVLRRGGAMVVCGRTAGRYPEFDVRDLYFGHKRIVGSTLGTQPDLERLVSFVADGRLSPVVAEEYPLAETRRAFEDMRDRDRVGKLVVRPQQ
ncbi:MAG: alcohol dehydrogenase catalytic domain-containing protein [Haloarculaceae archaeon]